ncbi:MAG: N-acetylneuraminate synthase family protein [Candidatus Schekmanbacteria bacterium]|nr:N-acetylneuraminate synthase family protein [Candidatus Schekmanbacteria bacterium]
MAWTNLGRTTLIAEAGLNHDGSLATALHLVGAAAIAGADAVKFQTFRADRLVARRRPEWELFRQWELPPEAWRELAREAARLDLELMSTPFDEDSLALLVDLGVKRIKVASGDLTYLPLLRAVAHTELPVLLSTGMSGLGEIEQAVSCLEESGAGEITLLHCVSAYPCPAPALNLRAMDTLRSAFGLPVGLSDHTLGTAAAVAAVARGAVVVEKHFTLDRGAPGPDHALSLDPETFRQLVNDVRFVEAALGDGRKALQACEEPSRRFGRRALHASRDLPAGHRLELEDLEALRPADGLPPQALSVVVGRKLRRALISGEPVTWEDV